MKKLSFYIVLLCTGLTFQGCSSSDDEEKLVSPTEDTDPEDKPSQENEWVTLANESTAAFIKNYWNKQEMFYNYYPNRADGSGEAWNYWPQAHAMDVVIDAYARSKDTQWKLDFTNWWQNCKKKTNNGTYFNDFIDDMEWICLTMIRLYEFTEEHKYMQTAEELWDKINDYWDDKTGGGLYWKTNSKATKNACSNGPAGIIAARMYQLNGEKKEDLEWAKKIYEWETATLVDKDGAVYDNIDTTSGEIKKWTFTYNSGTYVGTAHELYKITGDKQYLSAACKAANWCINNLVQDSSEGKILKDEGKGDGGLFKGIFIRYFVRLLLEKDITDYYRSSFRVFLANNAKVLKEQGTGNGYFYSTSWTQPGDKGNDMPTQVSGCTMIEAKAFYEQASK